MRKQKHCADSISVVSGCLNRMAPDEKACEFGVPAAVSIILTAMCCAAGRQSIMLADIADRFPTITAVFLAVSIFAVLAAGKFREHIRKDAEKKKLCEETESLILEFAFTGITEAVLLIVIFLHEAVTFVLALPAVLASAFLFIELFLIVFIFMSAFTTITAVALINLQK